MADRDRWEEPDRDADDWFVGVNESGYESGAPTSVERGYGRTESRRPAVGENWLDDDEPSSRTLRHGPRVGSRRARLGLSVGLLVVVVLGSLAAAGVFSHARTTPTAATTTRTAASATTVQAPTTESVGVVPTSPLKPGDTGAQVVDLQHALAQLGYAPGAADGNYGPATQRAVERFQRASGLSADGIFGPKTLATLKRAAAGK
jgi:hypothetical protein